LEGIKSLDRVVALDELPLHRVIEGEVEDGVHVLNGAGFQSLTSQSLRNFFTCLRASGCDGVTTDVCSNRDTSSDQYI
jgi:hypothetical protein